MNRIQLFLTSGGPSPDQRRVSKNQFSLCYFIVNYALEAALVRVQALGYTGHEKPGVTA